MYVIGIDEAGIGPVMGPLVVSGVAVKKEKLDELRKAGVKDSKLFGSDERGREKREEILRKIEKLSEKFIYRIISAAQISRINIYHLEISEIAQILINLNYERAERIFIAYLGKLSKQKFMERLITVNDKISLNDFENRLVYEKDADAKFVVVSAASIISKVIRDREILKICKEVGEEYVSGYPNKKTAQFLARYLKKHNRLPPHLRKRNRWISFFQHSVSSSS